MKGFPLDVQIQKKKKKWDLAVERDLGWLTWVIRDKQGCFTLNLWKTGASGATVVPLAF